MENQKISDVDIPHLVLLMGGTYIAHKVLPDGSLCVLQRFMYTIGLTYDTTTEGYRGRFCFRDISDALAAIETYQGGSGEVPEGTVKPKGQLKSPNEGYWPDDWGWDHD